MVQTPWGATDELRSLALRAGPHTPPAEVDRNRRERLFAAMVGCLDEHGYEATTVQGLTELAGVSRSGFYELFDSKHDCFLSLVDAIVETSVAVTRQAYETHDAWDARMRAVLEAVLSLIAAFPATARACYIDSYTAGAEAVERAERATRAFEAMAAEALEDAPPPARIPSEVVAAAMGGIQAIIEMHVRGETADRLPALAPAIADWALGYRATSTPLRRPRARRGQPGTPRRIDHDPVERIVSAMVATVAERGYLNTTVADVTRAASTSLRTFYAHFEDKEDAALAAIQRGRAQVLAAIRPAYERAPDWPRAVHAAVHALMAFLAAEREWAHLGSMELRCAGPRAMGLVGEAIASFDELLAPGYELAQEPPPRVVTLAVTGAVERLVENQVRTVGADRLPEIGPLATYLVLTPFLGSEAAESVAATDPAGRVRDPAADAGVAPTD